MTAMSSNIQKLRPWVPITKSSSFLIPLSFWPSVRVSTSSLTNYVVSSVTAAGGTIPTNAAGGTFEQY